MNNTTTKKNKKKFITVKKPDLIIDLSPVFRGEDTMENVIKSFNKDINLITATVKEAVDEEMTNISTTTSTKWTKIKKWFKNILS